VISYEGGVGALIEKTYGVHMRVGLGELIEKIEFI
jgi:hypothetical protein